MSNPDEGNTVTPEQAKSFLKEHGIRIVIAIGVLGILKNNRKSFKYTKRLIAESKASKEVIRAAIEEARKAGRYAYYYPGIGLWVD